MAALVLALKILAFLLFMISGTGVPVPKVNLIAFGLASWVLADVLETGLG